MVPLTEDLLDGVAVAKMTDEDGWEILEEDFAVVEDGSKLFFSPKRTVIELDSTDDENDGAAVAQPQAPAKPQAPAMKPKAQLRAPAHPQMPAQPLLSRRRRHRRRCQPSLRRQHRRRDQLSLRRHAAQAQAPAHPHAPAQDHSHRRKQPARTCKRHRKGRVLRDNIQGITRPAICRLARRGGVRRISGLIYEGTRGAFKATFSSIIGKAVTVTKHQRERKTVTEAAVLYLVCTQRRGPQTLPVMSHYLDAMARQWPMAENPRGRQV